ncbi:MAG: DsbC family protein [Opitutaceae bacterium]|nr:DsbC family protein [Opitutaceae bacterium]
MRVLFFLTSVIWVSIAYAGETESVIKKLKALYPATQFDHVKETPIAGMFEVKMGENIAYVTRNGRYFFIGALYDMQDQVDLTAQAVSGRQASAQTAARTTGKRNSDIASLPVDKDAIVRVQGTGARTIVLFSDTECPYCRQLERTLASIQNVTIHTFPVAMFGPPENGVSIWCSADRAKAWNALMLDGEAPRKNACPNPLQRNTRLAGSLGVRGTPVMFNSNGEMLAGAQTKETIEAWLDF